MLLILLSLAAVQLEAAPEQTETPTIEVRARRTGQALAECLARRCGTREDAVATIRHAQMQFVAGAYPEARRTLLDALERNRAATGSDPRAMSALWYALARVTLHNGDMDEYRRAALRAGSILARAGKLPAEERLRGEIEIADALATSGDTLRASDRYRELGEKARAQGKAELADMLAVRALAARSGFQDRPLTRRKLEELGRDPDLGPRARSAALAFAAQLQEKGGSKTADLLASIPVQPADQPELLAWAPTDKYGRQREEQARAPGALGIILQPHSAEIKRHSWADIGFWVRPDGQVDDVQLLRSSRNSGWTREAIKIIKGRRYAKFAAEPGLQGRYRVERVTLTYDHLVPIGSLIRRRAGWPILRFEELKVEKGARVALE